MTQMSNSSETQVSADASAVKDDFDATPPRETMLSSNHPVTKGASTLCFNKAALSRADFDLEHFIILARHRASLSQIHHDLRVYLKFVQNSMIELINDDYADFVNLSSNLVGLKETIDKLDANVKSVWNEFSSRTSKSMSIATNVVQYSSDLIKCRQRQAEIRTKLSLIKAIDRLAKILKDMPDEYDKSWLYVLSGSVVDLEVWFRKAHEQNEQIVESHDSLILAVCETVEDWLVHDMNADCKYIDALLDILMLVNGVNSAVCKVMDDVIDGRIEKCHNDNLEMLLKSIFVEINKIRENLLLKLTSNVDGCISSNVSDFLDRCLLTYVVSVLEKYFGSLLIPTDCRLFHRCYLETCEFIKKWPRNSAHSHTILRMIREKFNIVVYYKLETQQILSNLKKLAAEIVETNSLLNDLENSANNDDEQLFFQYSNAIIDSLKRVWSDDVYLATLVNKLWDFSMSVLINYVEWLETFTRSLVDVKNSDEVDIWRLVCVSISDAEVFDNRVFDLALSIIWDKIRELNLDVTPFGRCLSSFSSILNGKVEELKSSLAGMVVRKLSKVLDGVTDIPRNYRWTKKPLPTQESSYVSEAFALFDDFQNELKRYSWSEENTKKVSVEILTSAMGNFSKNAEQVFDSVEQTGSSLQRFKRRTATTGVPDSGNVDSDDNKIRTQLLLDLTICQDWCVRYYVPSESISNLISRAKGTDKFCKTSISVNS